MPTTCPRWLRSGPPAPSGFGVRSTARLPPLPAPVARTVATVGARPTAPPFPIASTRSPTARIQESPSAMTGSPLCSTFRIAMSFSRSRATTAAGSVRPSWSVTWMALTPLTVRSCVTMYPCRSMMNPRFGRGWSSAGVRLGAPWSVLVRFEKRTSTTARINAAIDNLSHRGDSEAHVGKSCSHCDAPAALGSRADRLTNRAWALARPRLAGRLWQRDDRQRLLRVPAAHGFARLGGCGGAARLSRRRRGRARGLPRWRRHRQARVDTLVGDESTALGRLAPEDPGDSEEDRRSQDHARDARDRYGVRPDAFANSLQGTGASRCGRRERFHTAFAARLAAPRAVGKRGPEGRRACDPVLPVLCALGAIVEVRSSSCSRLRLRLDLRKHQGQQETSPSRHRPS